MLRPEFFSGMKNLFDSSILLMIEQDMTNSLAKVMVMSMSLCISAPWLIFYNGRDDVGVDNIWEKFFALLYR